MRASVRYVNNSAIKKFRSLVNCVYDFVSRGSAPVCCPRLSGLKGFKENQEEGQDLDE